jgi:hypothetical protein
VVALILVGMVGFAGRQVEKSMGGRPA